jgi:hypothetical protein
VHDVAVTRDALAVWAGVAGLGAAPKRKDAAKRVSWDDD